MIQTSTPTREGAVTEWITDIPTTPTPTELPTQPISKFQISTVLISSTLWLTPPTAVPVTTVFTPPTMCSSFWMLQHETEIFSPSSKDCLPYGIAFTYSPAICTSGQTLAYVVESKAPTDATKGYSRLWEGFCCNRYVRSLSAESWFDILNFASGMFYVVSKSSCIEVFTSGFSAGTTFNNYPTTPFTMGTGPEPDFKTIVTSGTALADPFIVWWIEDDLSLFPSTYATSLASALGLQLSTSSSTPSLSLSSPTPPVPTVIQKPQSLSRGAKIGIGISAAVFFIAVVVIILALYYRRKPKSSTRHNPPELDNTEHSKKFFRGRWRAEAETVEIPQELDSRAVNLLVQSPVELPEGRVAKPESQD